MYYATYGLWVDDDNVIPKNMCGVPAVVLPISETASEEPVSPTTTVPPKEDSPSTADQSPS